MTQEADGVFTPVIDEVNPFVVRANGQEEVFEHEGESINNAGGLAVMGWEIGLDRGYATGRKSRCGSRREV